MALITNTNYASYLKESTNPRGSAPNGNIYFDVANNKIQLIGADELATFDHTSMGGGATDANQLTNFDGITMRALYNFENARRKVNETLRKYKRGTDGDYRFAGAFNFINGVKLDGTDRNKVRGSGWQEFANSGDGKTALDRVYHGVASLVDIQPTTVPKYALVTATDEATLQAATWNDFVRLGDINEAIQVFGSTANGDATAGNFDYRTRIAVVRVRSWQYNPGETTSVLTGITEFSGFSAGYGVGESSNPANTYALADVAGGVAGIAGSRVAPWTGMSLEKLVSPQLEDGFSQGNDKEFTWVLHNSEAGTAQECAAFLDAMSIATGDIDSGTGTYTGYKGRVWYARNAAGKVVTSSVGGAGLFIEGLSAVEKQNCIFTDDAGTANTYPFYPSVEISVGAAALADANAWFHVYYHDGAAGADFDTSSAVTVQDKDGVDVKGLIAGSPRLSGGKISFQYDYVGDTDAGLPGNVDKAIVVVVEGHGVAAQAITGADGNTKITNSTTISITCAPPADTNA